MSLNEETLSAALTIFLVVLYMLIAFFAGILPWSGVVLSYLTQVHIYEDKLVYVHPLKRKKEIPISDITYWGCASFVIRSTAIYFCTADKETILRHLDDNWKHCIKAFTKDRVERLKTSQEGMLRLAVGTYVYKHFHFGKDVFVLYFGSENRLKKLVQALKMDAMITGPILLDRLDIWDEYAKYRGETQGQGENFPNSSQTDKIDPK